MTTFFFSRIPHSPLRTRQLSKRKIKQRPCTGVQSSFRWFINLSTRQECRVLNKACVKLLSVFSTVGENSWCCFCFLAKILPPQNLFLLLLHFLARSSILLASIQIRLRNVSEHLNIESKYIEMNYQKTYMTKTTLTSYSRYLGTDSGLAIAKEG